MTLTERLLAFSRRHRRQLLYRLARLHTGSLGISTDADGRGVIFDPRDLEFFDRPARETALVAASHHVLGRLNAAGVPTGIVRLIEADNADYRNADRTTH